ncbi:MAG TPA: Crp/Fnr family transcriptional regulator [Candidatus Eisenbacteria bacterium]|nr:Crp/Fnr family transcriptional regulator [Candidatus Eisenbacteria bacterium]
MDKTAVLDQLAFYTGAPPGLRRRIANAASYVRLAAGDLFYQEGDVGEVFAMVGRGDIRVFKTSETGREISLYHVQDGEPCLVNMLCVFLDRPAMASARIEVPTEAVVIPAPTFRDWVGSEDSVRTFVFAAMATRFVDVMTLVEEVAFRKVDVRLAELLLRRFSHRGLAVRVVETTHEELAAELGTAREVVSRLLKDFERTGIVSVARGRLELRDGAQLRHMVETS